VQQGPDAVVDEVAEAQGVASEGFEAAVDQRKAPNARVVSRMMRARRGRRRVRVAARDIRCRVGSRGLVVPA
jgi:hypothetical protein